MYVCSVEKTLMWLKLVFKNNFLYGLEKKHTNAQLWFQRITFEKIKDRSVH